MELINKDCYHPKSFIGLISISPIQLRDGPCRQLERFEKIFTSKGRYNMSKKQWKVPLYEQVKRHLINQMKEEQWQPGDEIPSERELMQEFNVSRTTVRQAILELARAGIIETRRGAVARVKDNKKDDFYPQGFVHHEIGQKFSLKVLRSEYLTDDPFSKHHLNLDDGEKTFYTERIRVADGLPIGIQKMYTPQYVGELIEDQIHAWYDVFPVLGMHEVFYNHLTENITAEIANQYEADLLGISPGDPLIVVHRKAIRKERQPIEYSILKYIPTYFDYRVQMVQ